MLSLQDSFSSQLSVVGKKILAVRLDPSKTGYSVRTKGKISGIESPNQPVVDRKISQLSTLFSGQLVNLLDLRIDSHKSCCLGFTTISVLHLDKGSLDIA